MDFTSSSSDEEDESLTEICNARAGNYLKV